MLAGSGTEAIMPELKSTIGFRLAKVDKDEDIDLSQHREEADGERD